MVEWDKILDRARKFFRAKLGLSLDDDVYQGLIHTNDNRERTRLTTHNVYRHAYMDILKEVGGEEFSLIGILAEEERHLFISEEGQRATDFIQSIAKKQEQQPVTNITMSNQQPGELKQENKGWFRR